MVQNRSVDDDAANAVTRRLKLELPNRGSRTIRSGGFEYAGIRTIRIARRIGDESDGNARQTPHWPARMAGVRRGGSPARIGRGQRKVTARVVVTVPWYPFMRLSRVTRSDAAAAPRKTGGRLRRGSS